MERLSDERLARIVKTERSYAPDGDAPNAALYMRDVLAMATELQQLRAAKAADRERVWETVNGAAFATFSNPENPHLSVNHCYRMSDTDRRTLEWLRGVMAYTADGDSGGMAARANATIDRLLSDRPAPVRPFPGDTDRRHLVALRGFIAGIDGQRGHGNDWSAELALLDRLLAAQAVAP